MRTWLLRGAVMAVVHAAAETLRADFGVQHPTSRTLFEAITLGLLVGVAAVWGALDRWHGVEDAGRAWLIGSLVAGWGSAVLAIIGKAIFVDQTGVADLGAALTGGAAFTALLVLIPASIGLVAGNWIRANKAADDDEDEYEEDDPGVNWFEEGRIEGRIDDEDGASEVGRRGRARARRRPTAAE